MGIFLDFYNRKENMLNYKWSVNLNDKPILSGPHIDLCGGTGSQHGETRQTARAFVELIDLNDKKLYEACTENNTNKIIEDYIEVEKIYPTPKPEPYGDTNAWLDYPMPDIRKSDLMKDAISAKRMNPTPKNIPFTPPVDLIKTQVVDEPKQCGSYPNCRTSNLIKAAIAAEKAYPTPKGKGLCEQPDYQAVVETEKKYPTPKSEIKKESTLLYEEAANCLDDLLIMRNNPPEFHSEPDWGYLAGTCKNQPEAFTYTFTPSTRESPLVDSDYGNWAHIAGVQPAPVVKAVIQEATPVVHAPTLDKLLATHAPVLLGKLLQIFNTRLPKCKIGVGINGVTINGCQTVFDLASLDQAYLGLLAIIDEDAAVKTIADIIVQKVQGLFI